MIWRLKSLLVIREITEVEDLVEDFMDVQTLF